MCSFFCMTCFLVGSCGKTSAVRSTKGQTQSREGSSGLSPASSARFAPSTISCDRKRESPISSKHYNVDETDGRSRNEQVGPAVEDALYPLHSPHRFTFSRPHVPRHPSRDFSQLAQTTHSGCPTAFGCVYRALLFPLRCSASRELLPRFP